MLRGYQCRSSWINHVRRELQVQPLSSASGNVPSQCLGITECGRCQAHLGVRSVPEVSPGQKDLAGRFAAQLELC